MDLALGAPADRPLNAWEYSFIPMRLRDELQSVLVPGPDGSMVALAGPPRVIVDAEREAEPPAIDSRRVRGAILASALLLALLAMGLARPAAGWQGVRTTGLIAAGVSIHLVMGLLATLIVFMWAFTLHAFWAWNPHLLLFTPFSLIVAVAIPFSMRRPRLRRWLRRYNFTMAASAFIVAIVALIATSRGVDGGREMLIAWAGASWLVHLAFGFALDRAGRSTGGPDPVPPHAETATSGAALA
jgi:hypothetical protein